eukprot:TRINITY_DN71296_c0_g1_i1.p1 TRINITY_DN71296_c0_g1~~TRINITY_DN71296_c0_g1_i1.p1  ORF type:complete len:383 (+),score=48.41 TRINITY_DN71296_c0_g1_i1:70-1218(+)
MPASPWSRQLAFLFLIGAHARRAGLQAMREHGAVEEFDLAWPTMEEVKKSLLKVGKPGEITDKSDEITRKFFVFLDVYDLVAVDPTVEGGVAGSLAGSAAGSVAGSMVGGSAGSVAGSAVGAVGGAAGGAGVQAAREAGFDPQGKMRELPAEIPAHFRAVLGKGGLLQLEEEATLGLNMSVGRSFTHSEVSLCEAFQFESAGDDKYLNKMQGRVIPEEWSLDPSRMNKRCLLTSYGAADCKTPFCGISIQDVRLASVTSPPYGARTRIALGIGLVNLQSNRQSSSQALVKIVLSKRDQWQGVHYDFVGHNCNNYARWFVRCVLNMAMPSQFTLGANHAVSSTPWSQWIGSIAASAAGGLAFGPLGLAAGPMLFMATPSEICL